MLTNRSHLVAALSLFAVAVVAAAPTQAAVFTGSLSTDGGANGLLVPYTNSSWDSGTRLAWSVNTAYAPGLVKYVYTLRVLAGCAAGISHMTFELTGQPDPFTANDLAPGSTPVCKMEIGPRPVNPGSPHQPSGLGNAVKYDPSHGDEEEEEEDSLGLTRSVRYNTATLTLITTRLPMWGDFYAKGGDSNEVWNAGFGTAAQEADPSSTYFDPTDTAASGSIRNHVLVPNRHEVETMPFRVIKFRDDDRDGEMDLGELVLGAGWQFEVSGGDLPSAVLLTTGVNGITQLTDLTEGVSYLVTELVIPAGWLQTTNGGNPIPVTMQEGVNPLYVGNIPEPTTLSVLALGGVAVLIRRRRA